MLEDLKDTVLHFSFHHSIYILTWDGLQSIVKDSSSIEAV